MNIIGNIVSRDCHVGMSHKRVIRHVISRLKNKDSTFWALPKDQRRALIQTCVKEHNENRALYNYVMKGV